MPAGARLRSHRSDGYAIRQRALSGGVHAAGSLDGENDVEMRRRGAAAAMEREGETVAVPDARSAADVVHLRARHELRPGAGGAELRPVVGRRRLHRRRMVGPDRVSAHAYLPAPRCAAAQRRRADRDLEGRVPIRAEGPRRTDHRLRMPGRLAGRAVRLPGRRPPHRRHAAPSIGYSPAAMKPLNLIAIALFICLWAPLAAAQDNPFFKPSTLPYGAPPFDKIKDSDYQPAIEEGMKQELAEVEAIANNPAAPTFANTFEALEKSGALLRRVQRVFGGLAQSNTNPTIQKIQQEMARPLSEHRDAIVLNPKLFARIKAIHDQRDTLKLDAEQKRLVDETYRDFVRAGALLSDADKEKLRALNK